MTTTQTQTKAKVNPSIVSGALKSKSASKPVKHIKDFESSKDKKAKAKAKADADKAKAKAKLEATKAKAIAEQKAKDDKVLNQFAKLSQAFISSKESKALSASMELAIPVLNKMDKESKTLWIEKHLVPAILAKYKGTDNPATYGRSNRGTPQFYSTKSKDNRHGAATQLLRYITTLEKDKEIKAEEKKDKKENKLKAQGAKEALDFGSPFKNERAKGVLLGINKLNANGFVALQKYLDELLKDKANLA